MSKLWKVLVVLVLGARLEVPPPESGRGMSADLNGPALAIALYGVLLVIALTKLLNQFPGVFALRRPLGVVRSGYDYLWAPAIVAATIQLTYVGEIDGREGVDARWTLTYGENELSFAALCVFAALMLALKFRATMIEANSRLDPA
jgi:hypothetical protein